MFKKRSSGRGLVILAVIAVVTAWVIMVSGVLAQDEGGIPPIQGGELYTVEIGDTLDTIAQRYNVSIISLFEVNGLDYSSYIFPGDTLLIPNDGTPYGYYPGLNLGNPNGTAFYILQPLDVLDLVAAFFDIDLQCLAEANGIEDPNDVEPGYIIGLPIDCPTYRGTSSMPLRPLRGAALTGASVRLMQGDSSTPTATPTAFAPLATPTATVIAPVIIQPTATEPGVIIETPVPGGIMRGPTVTPTPIG